MSHRLLLCPRSRRPLERALVGGEPALVSEDGTWAFRIDEEVPVLLAPEALREPVNGRVEDARYEEAYDEMSYYDGIAEGWAQALQEALRAQLRPDPLRASDDPVREGLRLAALAREHPSGLAFPDPPSAWVHLRFEAAALHDAYRHLAPVHGKRILQVGGIGLDAVKFLLAGAREVWLAAPMAGELAFGAVLADACGVGDRLRRVRAVAEELPFADATFDAAFAGGSIHHTLTSLSLPEFARVLRPGGRFASVEPWHAPGYTFGTRLLGKREPVHCRPLDAERVAPLFDAFDEASILHHGTLTRYPLVALAKLGARLPMRAVRMLTQLDDLISAPLRPLRTAGSSVALLGIASR